MSAPEPRVMVLCCPELCCPELCGPELCGPQPGGPDLPAPGPGAARLFEQVITAVTAFCPRVEAVEPGVCAFGARGPARYFGGETALAGQIIAAIAQVGVRARAGVADGLFAARLAARSTGPAGTGPAAASSSLTNPSLSPASPSPSPSPASSSPPAPAPVPAPPAPAPPAPAPIPPVAVRS